MNDNVETAPFSVVQISKRRYIVVRAMGSGMSWETGTPRPDYMTRSLSPCDADGNAVYFGRDGVSAAPSWDMADALAHRNAFNAKWMRYRKTNTEIMQREDDRAGVSFRERVATCTCANEFGSRRLNPACPVHTGGEPERPSERAMRLADADRANHNTAVKLSGVHTDPSCSVCGETIPGATL